MSNNILDTPAAFLHFASVIRGDALMAMFSAYFDDSGTHPESPVAVAACFMSDKLRWKKFDSLWAEMLKAEGVSSLHMSDLMSGGGEFREWSRDRRDAVIRQACAIIKECAWMGHATAVMKADYDAVITGRLREKVGNRHYTFAVQSCVAHLEPEFRLHPLPTGDSVQYVFDRMTKGHGEISDLFSDLVQDPVGRVFGIEHGGWAFQDKRLFLPLQAADILAWEAYRYMQDYVIGNKGGTIPPPFVTMTDVPIYLPRLFHKTELTQFADFATKEYEKRGWNAPKGAFFLPEKD